MVSPSEFDFQTNFGKTYEEVKDNCGVARAKTLLMGPSDMRTTAKFLSLSTYTWMRHMLIPSIIGVQPNWLMQESFKIYEKVYNASLPGPI